ncbi:MAG: hypothetical protein QXQ28_05030 [Candidatus Nezhaarchaeales archaeon]
MISKRICRKLEAFTPLEKPYELRTADKEGKLKIKGFTGMEKWWRLKLSSIQALEGAISVKKSRRKSATSLTRKLKRYH